MCYPIQTICFSLGGNHHPEISCFITQLSHTHTHAHLNNAEFCWLLNNIKKACLFLFNYITKIFFRLLSSTVCSFSLLNNNPLWEYIKMYPFSWWWVFRLFSGFALANGIALNIHATSLGEHMQEWKCWVTALRFLSFMKLNTKLFSNLLIYMYLHQQ